MLHDSHHCSVFDVSFEHKVHLLVPTLQCVGSPSQCVEHKNVGALRPMDKVGARLGPCDVVQPLHPSRMCRIVVDNQQSRYPIGNSMGSPPGRDGRLNLSKKKLQKHFTTVILFPKDASKWLLFGSLILRDQNTFLLVGRPQDDTVLWCL